MTHRGVGVLAEVTPETPTESPGFNTFRSIGFVAAGAACFHLIHQATFPTLPIYMSLRGASEQEIAFVIGAIGILAIGFRPFTGWLIDNWGRRRTQTAALIALAFVAGGYAFSSLLVQFGLLRSVQSIAVGGSNTAVSTYVSDVAPTSRRAEFLGYVNAAQTVATAVGPTIGFAMLSIPAILTPNPVWLPGLSSLGGYNFTALFALMVAIALVGAGITIFAPESKRAGSGRRLSWKHLLYRPATVPMLLMAGLIVPHAGVITYLPFYVGERGLSNVGLYFTFQALGILAAGLTLGRMADRFGRRVVVTLCMLGVGSAMVLLASARSPWLILVAGVATGICQGGARNGLAAWTADHAPPSERGAALSTTNMGFDIGITIGAIGLGLIVPSVGIANGFFVIASVPILGALISLVYLKDKRQLAS